MPIHVLDKAVAELIAAGEVVERPASIVKELLENSIDAGATNISVEITGGGIQMIRISDNGRGISREDVPKAFLRHATSKVCKASDLDSILTLGFRGEALASIAAMCRVELETKSGDEDEGTLYTIEGGSPAACVPAGRPTGATITVRDVFFNTPARMKFLKKDTSEGSSVAQVVDKCALSHPEIAFKFIREGSVKLKTSGNGDLLAVIYSIYGREFARDMLEVDYTYEDFARVYGYISNPGAAKPSRTYQNFFINGRFIKTRTGVSALEEAYKHKIMAGKFPACVLKLELDAAGVDVNVHPAKLEVRFANEKPVFSSVYYAVKTALAKLENPLGAVSSRTESAASPSGPERLSAREFRDLYAANYDTGAHKATPSYTDLTLPGFDKLASRPLAMRSSKLDISVDEPAPPQKSGAQAQFAKIIPDENIKMFNKPAINVEEHATTIENENIRSDSSPVPENFRLAGEVFGTYILIEDNDELVLVDKHAAHERLIYERMKAGLEHGNRQVLLKPQSVVLSRDEHSALIENADEVEKLGFLIEDFGGGAVIVREVPIELAESDIDFILREVADKLKNNSRDLTPKILDRLYYSIACRSAVKANDKNSGGELLEIVRQLKENPSITHCPHGRPVLIRLNRRDLEKMFGRLG